MERKLYLRCVVVVMTLLSVTGCKWNSDFRVHEKPAEHAKTMDYKEFLDPKDDINPIKPEDEAKESYMEQKIQESIKK